MEVFRLSHYLGVCQSLHLEHSAHAQHDCAFESGSQRIVEASEKVSPPEFDDLAAVGDQDYAGHTDEETVLDHAGHVAELAGEGVGVGNLAEAAVSKTTIKDVIVLVGQIGIAVGVAAEGDLRAQRFNSLRDQGLRELDHFHGQREPAKDRNSLAGIGLDHELLRGRGDDLFPQQRAAATFNQA